MSDGYTIFKDVFDGLEERVDSGVAELFPSSRIISPEADPATWSDMAFSLEMDMDGEDTLNTPLLMMSTATFRASYIVDNMDEREAYRRAFDAVAKMILALEEPATGEPLCSVSIQFVGNDYTMNATREWLFSETVFNVLFTLEP